MKVLWFAGNPSLYANKASHNGGGWIASLQKELLKQEAYNIQLAVAFPWEHSFKQKDQFITYYGVKKIKRIFFRYKSKEAKCLQEIKKVIEDFKPNVIHVFGTEEIFGLASTCTHIPVIIHLQGILAACKEAWLPYSMSWFIFKFSNLKNYITEIGLKKVIKRESQIFNACKYYMGRTEWDKNITHIFNPKSQYFYCSEMLRPEIYYSSQTWKYHEERPIRKIISVISHPVYKGGDIILRVAQILKQQLKISFIWDVYGIQEMNIWEKLTNLEHENVNVYPKGIINAKQLVDVITSADVFVHPSYIENSPNSVCEAQILGIPIIVCNVGGVSSIVTGDQTGILVPTNDIFMLAAKIKDLIENKSLAENLGNNARIEALTRHSPQKIIKDLTNIYHSIAR